MKTRYIILLCVSVICVGICIYLGFFYPWAVEDAGEDLESLRDSIKLFASVPADTEGGTTDGSDTESDTTECTETVTSAGEDTVPAAPESDVQPDTTALQTTEAEETSAAPTTTATPVQTAVPQPLPPYGTLDFEKLWEVNPEICAWIEIPGTKIDYPILQSPDNDKKYLTTAYNGSGYVGGAIFTEATYNSTDFNDPVTAVYGHTMRAGTMFGQLQRLYSTPSSFAANSDITVYLPGEVRHYTVFAAVPYDNIHLLDTYDFENEYWYNLFFKDAKRIRAIGANFNKDISPQPGDRVIILSVCLNEDTARRYLVMAVYSEDLADNSEET